MNAPISEIFCSVQGEGPYVGMRQVFVRFIGCNLQCWYCDTQKGYTDICRFEKEPGSAIFESLPNPLDVNTVIDAVESFGNVHSVSLTGGEPLLHADFIKNLQTSSPIYLESNMTMPDMAKKIKHKVSFVSGDVKLINEIECDDFETHIKRTIDSFRILKTTESRDCFCKIVILNNTKSEDVLDIVDDISDYISGVILQPVTQYNDRPSVQFLLNLQKLLLGNTGINTRIIPQTHKMLGCL